MRRVRDEDTHGAVFLPLDAREPSERRGASAADDHPDEQDRERHAEARARREDLPRQAFDLRAGRPQLRVVPDLGRLELTDARQERRVHGAEDREEAHEDGEARLEHELRRDEAGGQDQHVEGRGPPDVGAELLEPGVDLQDVLLDRRGAPSGPSSPWVRRLDIL